MVLAGDALVTLSIVTGETGRRKMPGSFNADSEVLLASLGRLSGLGTQVMLPDLGEPWHGFMADSFEEARAVGPS